LIHIKSLIASVKHLNSPGPSFTRRGAEEKVHANSNET
jgi:hypothetical protein